MEDQENQEKNVKESSPIEKKKETKVEIEKSSKAEYSNGAGPSTSDFNDLPGAISTPKMLRTGLSKSEHSIPRIITRQDVANALKMTSISFGTPNPHVKNLNLKDLKIPIPLEKRDEKVDSATMLDLKKFMASCFKFNKETPVTNLPEMPVRVIDSIVPEMLVLPNVASSSCAQTDECITVVLQKANEVIVTSPAVANSPAAIEAKVSKLGSEKKSKPDSLSERSDLGLANRDSLSSIGSNVCRICMTRGRERLISPCNCKGSLANVHLSCLERWLNQVGRNHCELCGFSYPAIRTPRYTVLQALRLWFGNPRNRSHLQSDCLIFWLLSTVTAGLLAVCIVGTQYFVIEGSKFGISHRITETAMDFFMAVVLCGYSVTVYLLWKDHFVMWNRWRRSNVNVRLLLTPDAEPVPFVPRRFNDV